VGRVLSNADFTMTDLSEANLNWIDLTGASFNSTRMKGTDLSGANLTDARFSSVDLSRVRGLEQAQLDSAKGDLDTILPEDLTRPAHWQ